MLAALRAILVAMRFLVLRVLLGLRFALTPWVPLLHVIRALLAFVRIPYNTLEKIAPLEPVDVFDQRHTAIYTFLAIPVS